MTPEVDDAVLMTMAGIAYGAPTAIPGYLAKATPTAGWSAAWLPSPPDPPVNFAFMATSADAANAVLAIRGTYPNPFSAAYWDDANEDSPFGPMADWPGGGAAKISGGTATGLANLLALTDRGGVTLDAAVAALPAGATVTVTGHSLGGTLAPVVALHLAELFPDRQIEAASFAGMTPGNAAFAALFGAGTIMAGKVRRVYNTLDTVAYGWDRVLATVDFYQPAPRGGPLVAAMIAAMAARLELGGYDYAAVGTTVPLTGAVRPMPIPCEVIGYLFENLHQHLPDTYLALLGAPPLPFSILFGTVVAPRGPADAAAADPMQLPVVHLDA